MWEMIVTELNRAMHEFAQAFARLLPRLLVLLIIALVGWILASVLKAILRSVLRLLKFDRLSENAGAAELLKKAALPTSTELAGTAGVLGDLAGRDPGGRQCSRHCRIAGQRGTLLPVLASAVRCAVVDLLRDAGSEFLFTRCAADRREFELSFASAVELRDPRGHHYSCHLDGL